MSPRRTTVPPTRRHSRSSPQGRKELIARKKDEKQPAKRRTVLDDRFHRTDLSLSSERPRASVPDGRAEAYKARGVFSPEPMYGRWVGCSKKLGAGLQQGTSLRTYEYPHRSQSRKGDEVALYH